MHTAPPLDDTVGLRAPLVFAGIVLLVFGFGYALLGTGLAGALFPAAANGSLVERDGRVVGSALVAQPFADARYFRPRPSAAGYDPMAAAGSNQARGNPDLHKRLDAAVAEIAAREGIAADDVPLDLATQSGSGLDPDISPAAARVQIARVARARGLAPAQVARVVEAMTEAPQFGVLGAPRVNVLRLNLALDALPH